MKDLQLEHNSANYIHATFSFLLLVTSLRSIFFICTMKGNGLNEHYDLF
jgi:hypothetical protein